MLTADSFYKINNDTGHIPKSQRKIEKPINTNVSKLALSSVLSEIKKIKGFTTTKSLEFKTGYARSTIQRVVRMLADEDKILTKEVKNGRVKALHIKIKKG